VGVDGSTVRRNTIYLPGRWAVRILQENRDPRFVPCRRGAFEANLISSSASGMMQPSGSTSLPVR